MDKHWVSAIIQQLPQQIKAAPSQIEHRVPQSRPRNTIPPHLLRLLKHRVLRAFLPLPPLVVLGRISALLIPMQQLVQVAPSALARHVRPVRRGDETDSLGRARKHVAQVVGQTLEVVRIEPVLVVHDEIVRRSGGAFEAPVRCVMCISTHNPRFSYKVKQLTLEEEIKLVRWGDAAIDYRARKWVAVLCGIFRFGGVEARVVSLATDDDAKFGLVLAKVRKGLLQLCQLIFAYLHELALKGYS